MDDDRTALGRGAPVRSRATRLAADLEAPALARAFVRTTIEDLGRTTPQDAELLASEVTANAVRHAATESIEVRVDLGEDRVRVSVQDDDPEPPEVVATPPTTPGGLGMQLIQLLASDWGVDQIEGDGKVVWFEIPIPS